MLLRIDVTVEIPSINFVAIRTRNMSVRGDVLHRPFGFRLCVFSNRDHVII